MIRRVVRLRWLELGLLITVLLVVGFVALRGISVIVDRLVANMIISASSGNATFIVTRLRNRDRLWHRDENRFSQSNRMRYGDWMRHRHRFRYQEGHLN